MTTALTWHGDKLYWNSVLIGEQSKVSVAHGERLAEHLTVPHIVVSLAPVPGGDILLPTLSGIVGVERKAASDAVSSWYSGHLAEQLGIMLDYYDHVVLLLEEPDALPSHFAYFAQPAEQYHRWQDDLLTFQEAGVRLAYSGDLPGSAEVVGRLYRRYNKSVHHALSRVRLPQDSNTYRRILTTVPGWGPETAKSALKHIGPPIEVVNADVARLRSVPLITPRRIKLLFEAFGRRIHGRIQRNSKRGARGRTVEDSDRQVSSSSQHSC